MIHLIIEIIELRYAASVRAFGPDKKLGLDLDTGERLDRLHIRVHLWWVSRWTRRLLVVTGARCPPTKPVVTAVELQATTEPHCSRGVQPGGIYVYVGAARADSRRSGVRLAPRPQALPIPAAALVLYILLPPKAHSLYGVCAKQRSDTTPAAWVAHGENRYI
jgi:hypothetical protein